MTCSSCGTMFNCADTRRQPELSETRRYIVSRVKGFTISSVRGGMEKNNVKNKSQVSETDHFFCNFVEAKGCLSRRPRKWPHLDDTPEAIGEYLFIRPKLDSEHTFLYPLSSSHSSLFFPVTPPRPQSTRWQFRRNPDRRASTGPTLLSVSASRHFVV